jgi:hypothetical protein
MTEPASAPEPQPSADVYEEFNECDIVSTPARHAPTCRSYDPTVDERPLRLLAILDDTDEAAALEKWTRRMTMAQRDLYRRVASNAEVVNGTALSKSEPQPSVAEPLPCPQCGSLVTPTDWSVQPAAGSDSELQAVARTAERWGYVVVHRSEWTRILHQRPPEGNIAQPAAGSGGHTQVPTIARTRE